MAKQPPQSQQPQPSTQQQRLRLDYVDRPDVDETFADSISIVLFDGQTLKIELCATRFDPADLTAGQSGSGPQARRYPVCRLALPPAAAVDLFNRLQQTMAVLAQQGVIRQNPPAENLEPQALAEPRPARN